ncbi:MAG: 2-amino-4-hydroxy-6-hydroxymethyldihydropteridine diphosphokinase [Ascidiaceihabitans sp.]|jgi:2-amino-4-hydroxy-6-hydroxymethyldihydropteridine diphosphokinase
MKPSDMVVALGANQRTTDRTLEVTLGQAIQSVREKGAVIRAVSPFYQTPCFPIGAGPDYLNAAILISADWSPAQALVILHGIEHDFGRAREQRWGQRTLDLDLIAYDDVVAPDMETYQTWRDLQIETQKIRAPEQLILPHPRLQDRAFVLVPMADVVPNWVHPVSGHSVTEMLSRLPQAEIDAVVALKSP